MKECNNFNTLLLLYLLGAMIILSSCMPQKELEWVNSYEQLYQVTIPKSELNHYKLTRKSPPYISCVLEEYASSIDNVKMYMDVTCVPELFAFGFSHFGENDSIYHAVKDSLYKMNKEEIHLFVFDMIKPWLIKDLPYEIKTKLPENYNIQVKQQVFNNGTMAFVEYDNNRKYLLRRDKGIWKIYEIWPIEK